MFFIIWNSYKFTTAFYGHELDEWTNFQERIKDYKLGDPDKEEMDLTRHWVSYRGQTLSRTGLIMMSFVVCPY
jgi:callose synthase